MKKIIFILFSMLTVGNITMAETDVDPRIIVDDISTLSINGQPAIDFIGLYKIGPWEVTFCPGKGEDCSVTYAVTTAGGTGFSVKIKEEKDPGKNFVEFVYVGW